MPNRLLAFFLGLLLVFFSAAAESAQKPAREAPDDDDEELVQPAQPEPPKQTLIIEVKNDLLSVELANVDFGTVIRQIAGKAGFKVEGSGEVFSRKLNTKFADVGIERGVVRLLTLVRETNYTFHYDTKGSIVKLELFPASVGAPSGAKQPQRPQPAQRSLPPTQPQTPQVRPSPVTPAPALRRPVVPARPAAPQPRPAQPQVFPDDEDEDDDDE